LANDIWYAVAGFLSKNPNTIVYMFGSVRYLFRKMAKEMESSVNKGKTNFKAFYDTGKPMPSREFYHTVDILKPTMKPFMKLFANIFIKFPNVQIYAEKDDMKASDDYENTDRIDISWYRYYIETSPSMANLKLQTKEADIEEKNHYKLAEQMRNSMNPAQQQQQQTMWQTQFGFTPQQQQRYNQQYAQRYNQQQQYNHQHGQQYYDQQYDRYDHDPANQKYLDVSGYDEVGNRHFRGTPEQQQAYLDYQRQQESNGNINDDLCLARDYTKCAPGGAASASAHFCEWDNKYKMCATRGLSHADKKDYSERYKTTRNRRHKAMNTERICSNLDAGHDCSTQSDYCVTDGKFCVPITLADGRGRVYNSTEYNQYKHKYNSLKQSRQQMTQLERERTQAQNSPDWSPEQSREFDKRHDELMGDKFKGAVDRIADPNPPGWGQWFKSKLSWGGGSKKTKRKKQKSKSTKTKKSKSTKKSKGKQ